MHADDHPIQAGPIRHVDSEAADRWYADQTAKLTAAGFNWMGFTTHGATWRHQDHGDLYILHGVSNPADPSDTSIYSTVAHGDKRTAAVKYPPHVKNWSDKAHHLEQIPSEKRTPEEHAAYKKASAQSMYGAGQSPEYKAHLASEKNGGKRSGSASDACLFMDPDRQLDALARRQLGGSFFYSLHRQLSLQLAACSPV